MRHGEWNNRPCPVGRRAPCGKKRSLSKRENLLFTMFIALLAIGQAADFGTGLVRHWRLGETSGASAHDSSGNNNYGTVLGNPQWVAGKRDGGQPAEQKGELR